MTIAEGLTAVKLAGEAVSKVFDLLRSPKVNADDVRKEFTAMHDHIDSARRALVEADDENRGLRRQIEEMEQRQRLDADMEFEQDGGFWLRKSERDKGHFNPHCPVCWGDNRKAVPLTPGATTGHYSCALHHATYTTAAGKAALEQKIARMNAPAPRRHNPYY
jgi:hypothetical protein